MLNSVSILIQVCERASRVSQLPISTVILLIRYRLTPLIAAVFSRTFHRNMTEPGICCRSVIMFYTRFNIYHIPRMQNLRFFAPLLRFTLQMLRSFTILRYLTSVNSPRTSWSQLNAGKMSIRLL